MASRGPLVLPENYGDFLESLKQRVRLSQVRAAIAVNQELIMLYWHIGQEILSNVNKKSGGIKSLIASRRIQNKNFLICLVSRFEIFST